MAARRRRLRRNRQGRAHVIALQVLAVLAIVVVLLVGVGAASAATVANGWLQDLPDYKAPGAFDVAQATKIYSADGVLLARLYLENREVIPLSQMSTDLANAVVSVEDERFYTHRGVDPIGLARAAVANVTKGFGEEGASTITQQYVRNTILLNERTDISLARKVREAYLAMELEKRYTKPQILEMYLNAIYFGEGAYGAEAASRTYFAKDAKDLTLAEAATLAGLPQQPSRLDPYDNPDGAVARRNQVLRDMLRNGYIDQARCDEALATPLSVKRAKDPEDGVYAAPFFVAHVKKQLQSEFSRAVVFKGGLTVTTSIDMKMQKMAEAAVKDKLPKGPEVALVSIDPRTGYVKAMVGGRDYHKNKYNLATQGHRQPGSSFKTFALVTALDEGMPPYQRIDSSSPAFIPTKPKAWVVSNSEGQGKGSMSLEKATHLSVNTVYARLAWAVGAKKIARMAKRMGIETEIPSYPSIALGTRNVTPLEMASAYGTLAADGVHYQPIVITKVTDAQGNTLKENKPKGNRAVRPDIAREATSILVGVVTNGTATRAQIGRPVAGKTGTSQEHRDVWFVGYTPQLVTSVWVGYPSEKTIYVNGSRAFGGTVAAPIWASFMKAALAKQPKMAFKQPGKITYNPSKFKIPTGHSDTTKAVEPRKTTPKPKPKPTTPPPTNPGGEPTGTPAP